VLFGLGDRMQACEEVIDRLKIRVHVHDLVIESRNLDWRIS
jgi:hypothetical protein